MSVIIIKKKKNSVIIDHVKLVTSESPRIVFVSWVPSKHSVNVLDTTLGDRYSLSVTCDMSVVFSGHYGFLRQ